jgi:hypothetical protein
MRHWDCLAKKKNVVHSSLLEQSCIFEATPPPPIMGHVKQRKYGAKGKKAKRKSLVVRLRCFKKIPRKKQK